MPVSVEGPLVSCICISGSDVALLDRAVRCFQQQTYPNKELVIAYAENNLATTEYIRKLEDARVISLAFPVSQNLTLGEKRNRAIAISNGFYFCVWDDDDFFARSRITFQVQQLQGTPFKCVVLTRVLVYDASRREAYLSGERWAWEQTLLCEKSVSANPELRYTQLDRGEDSAFIFNLREHNLLTSFKNSGLYVYVYHGGNTSGQIHWNQNIFNYASKLSEAKSNLVEQVLDGKFSAKKAAIVLTGVVRS